jgi:hypothetical protein
MKNFFLTLGFVTVILLALVVGFAAGLFVDRQALLPVTGLFSQPDGGAAPAPGTLDNNLIQQALR